MQEKGHKGESNPCFTLSRVHNNRFFSAFFVKISFPLFWKILNTLYYEPCNY